MVSEWDMYYVGNSGSNPFGDITLSKKSKTKPMSGSNPELPKFEITGRWRADGKWKNDDIGFKIRRRPKTKIKQVITTPSGKKHTFKQIENTTGVQTTTGWIDKVTLDKGANTILGMSEQVDQFGNVVRGNNYANPDFYAYEKKKEKTDKINESLGISVKKFGYNPNDPKYKQKTLSELTGGLIGTAPAVNKRGISVTYGGVKKRNRQRRAAREQAMKASLKTNPNVVFANSLLSSIGKPQISTYNQRIGYGSRYTTKYTAEPIDVINDYYLKTGVIEYAKEQDPEHAKLDPKRTVSVVDVESSKQVANVWCHNNNCRTTGYRTVNTSTYKDVLISTRPKYIQMDALYGKIIDKSREKKVKYSGYYDVDPDVEVYNYYGISDDAFESYEGYKQNLLSTIGGRRANQEEIIKQLELDSATIDKKDRTKNKIPTLEKTNETLDTHATELKDKIDDYDWQGKIAQESFGSDTITGDSHVGHVLQSYGGEVRGDSYYSQDVGKLIRKTKIYERQLEQQIEDKSKEVEGIKLDKTESLVEFYNDKSNKEYGEASQEYLEKSLALTQKEREELEKARKSHAWGTNAPAPSAGRGGRGSRGRPSLRDKSRGDRSRRYRNRRTRGGQDTDELGGIV